VLKTALLLPGRKTSGEGAQVGLWGGQNKPRPKLENRTDSDRITGKKKE